MSESEARVAPAPALAIGEGPSVRRLGLGALHLTGPGIWGDFPDRELARRLLRRALELGVNFIDTAESYGPGSSESTIADALFPYPEGLVIATKGGLRKTGPGQLQPAGRPEDLAGSCEASLRRLRVSTIDLYQLHAVDPGVAIEESVGALKTLQEQGKIRHIGLCNVNAGLLERARSIAEIVSVQNQYSVGFRQWEGLLRSCEEAGTVFMPYRPLDFGALAQASDDLLTAIAQAHGATTAQIALAWLLHRSPVALVIPGTASISHLEENMAAGAVRLAPDELERLEGFSSEVGPLYPLEP